ncbi:PEP-utilizing enzyme [Mycobacterium avium]|nr:PEP-utilizing enzyme [Mycobacterium avium]MBZ4509537.1 pyruvate, water dikinase [Mycobacterium avium subsp. hominissuis]MBZ4517291.1 pyruvate, water dikinase [Mycobacterium avium subsp. hominissuis]MBZ4527143.1 pyruvate, water dikinase [Mycobacterium avium subsp. hominissuis]MBZ4546438.1 pyruvate, water dikinase [Mycobacterium avium subsp. hominissuis]MBZ4556101.1 pyruvate, water dikinase [Mycobacterium avium subsp. hominissuis]
MSVDLHTPNPMHRESGPNDAWSTINTRENYQGVMSPLGATLWLPISDLAVNGSFYDLGVLRRDEVRVATTAAESSSTVFYGRYTASINYFRRISSLIPGQSGAAFEEQIFGSSREDVADTPSRRRYPVIAVKAPVTLMRLPRRVRTMTREVASWWRYATSAPGLARPVDQQFAQAFKMLEYAMRVHVTETFVAQGIFDALGKLAESAGRPGLHLELSTGYGQMVETELVAALHEVAQGRAEMAEFLARYGYRCAGEIEVSNPSWRERPELVKRMVDKYKAAPTRKNLAAAATARTRARQQAERELLAALPRWKRPLGRLLIKLAATFIPLREEGKSALAMAFDGARAACGIRGAELAAAGVVDRSEDVFYLTIDEIRGTPPAEARALIARRRELRAAYEQIDVPDAWIGPPVAVSVANSGNSRVGSLSGVAAAHGVAEGPARVLASADDLDDLEPDEILVCRTTDPSWASAFHLAAGAVIDIGSTSSHGAIIAREMGMPCVIGTGNGTQLLRTGDFIRVDGSTGIVTVLQEAKRA